MITAALRTPPQTKCNIVLLLSLFTEAVWQPWGENIRKTLCSLSGVKRYQDQWNRSRCRCCWVEAHLFPHLCMVRAVCQVAPVCQIPHVHMGWNVSKNALDSLSHSQQVSQAAPLPAERVVNGTVLPVDGHSCRAPSLTLGLAHLTQSYNIMLLAIKWPYGAVSQENQLLFQPVLGNTIDW